MEHRKKIILRAIVENYITDAEPIGSKFLSSKLDEAAQLSSATLRNEMASLESLGYLEHPHTSAGRVPTAKGYRMYVDELMAQHRLTLSEMEAINRAMKIKMKALDEVLAEAGRLVAQLTQYAAFTATPTPRSAAQIKHVEAFLADNASMVLVALTDSGVVKTTVLRLPESVGFVSEEDAKLFAKTILTGYVGKLQPIQSEALQFLHDVTQPDYEVFLAGETHLLNQPEYHDLSRAQRTLKYLSEKRKNLAQPNAQGVDELSADILKASHREDGVSILIGPENVAKELSDASVIMAQYELGGGVKGMIGVIGPTRMDYSKLASRLSYFAAALGKKLNE